MVATLLLLLKGPMQSWGHESRFRQRTTNNAPTKSGVIGLIAAAEGRRRIDPVDDLVQLRYAVRVDQPGTLLRDFQTAKADGDKDAKLSNRYYLSDAAFVAAIESENRELLEGVEQALHNPRFPLYLGRRSCPIPAKLVLGIREKDAVSALRSEPWHASIAHKKMRASKVELPIYRDAFPGEEGDRIRDIPISFSQERREYDWRRVVRESYGCQLENKYSTAEDPFFQAVISV